MKNKFWTAIALSAVLFLSGAVTGFFTGRMSTFNRHSNPPGPPPPPPEKVKNIMSNRMFQRLQLTPEQQIQIKPDIERWYNRMEELRRIHSPEYQAVFSELFDRISTILTPEQKVELDDFRQEMNRHRL